MNLHDHAPAHQTKNGTSVLLQPPDSQNPNPTDKSIMIHQVLMGKVDAVLTAPHTEDTDSGFV
jgi:hypothetical protein